MSNVIWNYLNKSDAVSSVNKIGKPIEKGKYLLTIRFSEDEESKVFCGKFKNNYFVVEENNCCVKWNDSGEFILSDFKDNLNWKISRIIAWSNYPTPAQTAKEMSIKRSKNRQFGYKYKKVDY